MWILLGFLSAALLGIYDICKKESVRDNAVLPVLLSSMVCSTLLLTPLWISHSSELTLNAHQHLLVFIKALIICTSGMCTYSGIKHVPLSLASPIAATRPAWVILGAVLIYGEVLSWIGWLAVCVVLCGLIAFSLIGKNEGFNIKNNRYLWLVIAGMLLGACSGIYDKYLLREMDRTAVQFYYAAEQALMMAAIVAVFWWPRRHQGTPFQWRWSIVGISLFWVTSDFVYFYALSQPGAMISVMAVIRRSGAIIPFLYGIVFMHDKQFKPKAVALTVVLLGVITLALTH